MHSPIAALFPQLPGDLGSIWACQNELRNQSRNVRSLRNDISELASTLTGWRGEAKSAFIRSKNNELSELANWEEGTRQAADALKNYYFKLEEAKQKVDAIRGQADDLWDDFQSLSFRDMKARWEEYKKKLEELVILYRIAKSSLSNEALNTAASLREALYFTPEDHQQIDIDNDGDLDDVDLGDTRKITHDELDDIHKHLQDPSKPLFDIRQHHIGDCHLLSTLNAYNQTKRGREYLASLVTPHYGTDGKIDGYFVDFPGYGRNEKRVFVQDVMLHGDTAGNSSKADLASIFEKAFVQSHDGGTKSMFPHGGASASFSAITMQKISGIPGIPDVNIGINHEHIKKVTIAAVSLGHPVVAESSLFAADAQVTADGKQENIKIASSHVYTVAAADENGVTLINPWGHNNRSDGSNTSTGATFTMSWEDFYANYGDVTVGFIP